MKVLFLHGWTSVPGGVKPTHLKLAGHDVLNPSLDDDDFDAAVRTAQAEFDQHRPDVVVGSSRGGAVAMNINVGKAPLVLLCPAWKKWGSATTLKPNSVVLHSRADDVVPFADSEELVANSDLPPESLIEVGSDHRLADPEPLKAMLEACEKSYSIEVFGVDPASSKGLVIWNGSDTTKIRAADSSKWLRSQEGKKHPVLVCWDSPLSFDPQFGLSDRPVEKVLRAEVQQWVKDGWIEKKAVSVLPFSGCSHWVISCHAAGVPFSESGAKSFPLAASVDQLRKGGVWLVEAHPAVALAIWWLESSSRPRPLPVYKKDRSACRFIVEQLGFHILAHRSDLNDDMLDAFVAYRLGVMFTTGEAVWIGDPQSGGFILPVSAETKWKLGSKVRQAVSKSKRNPPTL